MYFSRVCFNLTDCCNNTARPCLYRFAYFIIFFSFSSCTLKFLLTTYTCIFMTVTFFLIVSIFQKKTTYVEKLTKYTLFYLQFITIYVKNCFSFSFFHSLSFFDRCLSTLIFYLSLPIHYFILYCVNIY